MWRKFCCHCCCITCLCTFLFPSDGKCYHWMCKVGKALLTYLDIYGACSLLLMWGVLRVLLLCDVRPFCCTVSQKQMYGTFHYFFSSRPLCLYPRVIYFFGSLISTENSNTGTVYRKFEHFSILYCCIINFLNSFCNTYKRFEIIVQ